MPKSQVTKILNSKLTYKLKLFLGDGLINIIFQVVPARHAIFVPTAAVSHTTHLLMDRFSVSPRRKRRSQCGARVIPEIFMGATGTEELGPRKHSKPFSGQHPLAVSTCTPCLCVLVKK